jgi:hypothetical protein
MIHIVIIAAIVAATITTAIAQPAAPVRPHVSAAAGTWAVVPAGERTVSHCLMGLRSDAAAPRPGKPQAMVSADRQFVILRVRAAEWSFSASRDVAVTLATAGGIERQPHAVVRGPDLIDIAFGVERERMAELAASSHLEIRAEGSAVRLPLNGLAEVLPAYRACLASIGEPNRQTHASIAAR